MVARAAALLLYILATDWIFVAADLRSSCMAVRGLSLTGSVHTDSTASKETLRSIDASSDGEILSEHASVLDPSAVPTMTTSPGTSRILPSPLGTDSRMTIPSWNVSCVPNE